MWGDVLGKCVLTQWAAKWSLNPSDTAKVLCVQKSRISEWVRQGSEQRLPPYIEAHIETFDMLSDVKAKKIIKERTGKCFS